MGLLGTLIIGFIVGALAKLIMPGKDVGGFIVTTLLGIIGAFVGTYVGSWLGFYEVGEEAGFIASLLGALLVLFLYRKFVQKRH
ncbi:GlsB/YeaQ/YmgE family stress response membrane protein [Bdellovibrio sp. 22V]|uniref:GlsB/YeaQ/YmgE family stress response membrane protein n=1 Tax=Bdellovibrio TaxID=958 RepID=UPI002543E0BA|nr:GlsB/YeaQ/YmgE family stress response membrane protein [Bdellovibrio sp. 22V]WII70919.1 GlsB/YeaQ/YmgE family stress response membrane protein [Bdellovibrio sp. 22V]